MDFFCTEGKLEKTKLKMPGPILKLHCKVEHLLLKSIPHYSDFYLIMGEVKHYLGLTERQILCGEGPGHHNS